jgi:hypothetical protein
MGQPTVQQVVTDPEFHSLPLGEQQKVLRQVDPEFASLPAVEQSKAILGIAAKYRTKPATPSGSPTDMANAALAQQGLSVSAPKDFSRNNPMRRGVDTDPINRFALTTMIQSGQLAQGLALSAPITQAGSELYGDAKDVSALGLKGYLAKKQAEMQRPLAEQLGEKTGLDVQDIKENAESGNYAGLLGDAVPQIAMALVGGREMGGAKELPTGVNEGRTVGSRLVDSIIRPSVKDFNFGKNPGGQIPAEGITAASQGGLLEKISAKKAGLGTQIEAKLKESATASQGGKQGFIDAQPLIDGPIDKAVADAAQKNDQALVNKLNDLRASLKENLVIGPDGKITSAGPKTLTMDAVEAAKLKRSIGEDTKWSNDPHADDLNSARVQIYRQIDSAIDSAAPGVADLNNRYANTLTAEKSLDRAIKMRQKHDVLSFKDVVTGAPAAFFAALAGHGSWEAFATAATAALIRRGVESTAAKTAVAKVLRSRAPGSTTGSLTGAAVAAGIGSQGNQPGDSAHQ